MQLFLVFSLYSELLDYKFLGGMPSLLRYLPEAHKLPSLVDRIPLHPNRPCREVTVSGWAFSPLVKALEVSGYSSYA